MCPLKAHHSSIRTATFHSKLLDAYFVYLFLRNKNYQLYYYCRNVRFHSSHRKLESRYTSRHPTYKRSRGVIRRKRHAMPTDFSKRMPTLESRDGRRSPYSKDYLSREQRLNRCSECRVCRQWVDADNDPYESRLSSDDSSTELDESSGDEGMIALAAERQSVPFHLLVFNSLLAPAPSLGKLMWTYL